MGRIQKALIALPNHRRLGNQVESLLFMAFGGADRDRTGGLLVANQALSQLSYSPKCQVSMLQGFRVSK
jgi:hypothetical protein